jgi:predicted enzyme related to lactoylglutathione lyase
MATEQDLGRFAWFDLMTSDPSGAVTFYTKLLGWGTQEWQAGDQPYTMWVNGETPLGGIMELPEPARQAGAQPHWLAYVAVPSVDAAAARTRKLGGSVVHEPTDVPGAGRFAVLSDPQGAMFAVYTSAQPAPPIPDGPPAVGEISWHELATTDHAAAYEFYADLFGWDEHEAMDMGEAGIYQMYGRNGVPLGGMFTKPAEMPGPPMWLYYVKVAAMDKAVAKIKKLGGQVINGPMEVPGGDMIAQCIDPQGAMFALHASAG